LIELKEVDKMETAMHTMNPDTAIPRAEVAPAETAPERQADAVSRGEFRLLLWMNAFALTAILGGMTVLYTGITDLRVAMEAQRAEILDVVRSEIGGLRTEIGAEIGGLRGEIGAEIGGLRGEIADLRERVARIETRLDTIETRLGAVETRLDTIIPPPVKSG
jgi:uncharacterized membrane protein